MNTVPINVTKDTEQHAYVTASNVKPHIGMDEKLESLPEDAESKTDSEGNLVYGNAEEEPELIIRTHVALAAMLLLVFVQLVALQGPPAVIGPPSCSEPIIELVA